MEKLRINAQTRQRVAKGDNRRLRAAGMVPAVVYGGKGEPVMVTVNEHELELILRGARRSSAIFTLALGQDGAQEQAIIREMQRHPVTSRVVHVDFQRVDMESEIEVEVPVHEVGSAPIGVRNGGILEHVTRTVTVRCTAATLPKRLDVDLSELELNASFHVSDLKLPEGIKVLDDPETALFTVLPPKGEAEGAAGAAEPEVIGKKQSEA